MRVSALPELQAYPPSFSPPPKAAMEAREFIRVRLHGIHPFIDGNGRTGRLLVNLELMKAGRIRTYQAELFDDILIETGEGAFEGELDLEELEDFEE